MTSRVVPTPSAEPSGLVVVPSTGDRWDALADLFGPRGADAGCWCMFYRLASNDWSFTRTQQNREDLHALAAAEPAPGLVAMSGDVAVGWCGLGPRRSFERLNRSRSLPPVDDRPVWSIVCFFVRRGWRSKGVARLLLRGAVEYARQNGAPALEAYPLDPGEQRLPSSGAYPGTVSMFQAAGFTRVGESTTAGRSTPRLIVRRELAATESAR